MGWPSTSPTRALTAFARINPCGYAGLQVVALSDLGGPSSLDAVKPVLLEQLGRQFGLAWQHEAAPALTP